MATLCKQVEYLLSKISFRLFYSFSHPLSSLECLGTATLEGLEIPHSFQQSLIVPPAPHQVLSHILYLVGRIPVFFPVVPFFFPRIPVFFQNSRFFSRSHFKVIFTGFINMRKIENLCCGLQVIYFC